MRLTRRRIHYLRLHITRFSFASSFRLNCLSHHIMAVVVRPGPCVPLLGLYRWVANWIGMWQGELALTHAHTTLSDAEWREIFKLPQQFRVFFFSFYLTNMLVWARLSINEFGAKINRLGPYECWLFATHIFIAIHLNVWIGYRHSKCVRRAKGNRIFLSVVYEELFFRHISANQLYFRCEFQIG